LKQQQAAGGAADPNQIFAAFTTLAATGTAGRSIPALDDAQWVYLNSNLKQTLLTIIEGYDRVAASGAVGARDNTKKVHKGIIRNGLKICKKSKRMGAARSADWHELFNYVKKESGKKKTILTTVPGPLPHPIYNPWMVVVEEKTKLKFQDHEATVVLTPAGLKMDDIWTALDDLFALRVKNIFSL
jgi:hypothetical protein